MLEYKTRRPIRIAERMRNELMELLLRGVVRDPRVAGVLVSEVTISKDLKYARVYIRLTDINKSEFERSDTVRVLNRASGYLRRELAPRLCLKYMPEMKFLWDDRADKAARVESLLEEIRREQEDQNKGHNE